MAVWPFPDTMTSAAGSPSSGSVRLSLLHVSAERANPNDTTKGRILRVKRRNSRLEE